MKKSINIAILTILFSCSTISNNDYSKEFSNHFKESKILLQSDSLIFPKETHIEPVLIPTVLNLNKEYIFTDEFSQELKVKRINYTDIKFEITNNNTSTKGIASISPNFYVGMETVGTKDGEFVVNLYMVKNTTIGCLYSIGIGNENIAKEGETSLYSYLNFKTDCTSKKIKSSTELLKLK